MKTYELTYIISPDATSEEVAAGAKEIETFVQSNEGLILKQENPVARTLSYQIKKHASGFLGILEFQIEAEKLAGLDEILKKNTKFVRHMLLIKWPAKKIKTRRTKKIVAPVLEKTEEKIEIKETKTEDVKEEKPATHEAKPKVELKDIEQQLDEILGE